MLVISGESRLGSGPFTFGQILPIMLLAAPCMVVVMELLSPATDDCIEAAYQATPTRLLPPPPAAVGGVASGCTTATRSNAIPYDKSFIQEHIQERIQERLETCNTSCKDWRSCSHQRSLGIRWTVLLLVFQVWYTFATTLYAFLYDWEGPTASLKPYTAWYVVTLPSTVYFMLLFTMEAKGSRKVNIPCFTLMVMYSAGTCPMFSIVYYLWPTCTNMWCGNGLGVVVMVSVYVICMGWNVVRLRFPQNREAGTRGCSNLA